MYPASRSGSRRSFDENYHIEGPSVFGAASNLRAGRRGEERGSRRDLSSSLPRRVVSFIEQHTDFLQHSDTTNPANTECPICFEDIENHVCVKIVGVPGCNHMIGLECLEAMLKQDPNGKKSCPLCRKEWISDANEEPSSANGGWYDTYNNFAAVRSANQYPDTGPFDSGSSSHRVAAGHDNYPPRSSYYNTQTREQPSAERSPRLNRIPYLPRSASMRNPYVEFPVNHPYRISGAQRDAMIDMRRRLEEQDSSYYEAPGYYSYSYSNGPGNSSSRYGTYRESSSGSRGRLVPPVGLGRRYSSRYDPGSGVYTRRAGDNSYMPQGRNVAPLSGSRYGNSGRSFSDDNDYGYFYP